MHAMLTMQRATAAQPVVLGSYMLAVCKLLFFSYIAYIAYIADIHC